MNNKPVAWMSKDYDGIKTDFYMVIERRKLPYRLYETAIPLYTHPVITPLTEDECEAIINRHDWFSKSWREMAKEIHDAILKKAQEK
jgi:hypothetical protein